MQGIIFQTRSLNFLGTLFTGRISNTAFKKKKFSIIDIVCRIYLIMALTHNALQYLLFLF